MPNLRMLALTMCLAGCNLSEAPPGGAESKYQYVGAYEQFATPMGSSVSVLMADGRKIKITSVDGTSYINIPLNNGIPEMRIAGTYGINGEFGDSSAAGVQWFIVREIEHLGGGQDAASARQRSRLPDFFTVDGDARGALTLSELRIEFPDSLARYFDDEDLECFYRHVEFLAADMGDPLTMPAIRRALLANSREQWDTMSDADRRLQMARYVTSMALSYC